MKLFALTDFPDDARSNYDEASVGEFVSVLKDIGFERLYVQYYGNKDYGWLWDNHAPSDPELDNLKKTASNIPNHSRILVEAAKKYGIEPVVVMRPLEHALWLVNTPYSKEVRENPGIPHLGGYMQIASNFLKNNLDKRIKRRSYDIDYDANKKPICCIKLKKQNNVKSRIEKENIKIYVSEENCHYTQYQNDFKFERCYEKAKEDVKISKTVPNYEEKVITHAGDEVEVIKLSGLQIREKYVVIEAACQGDANPDVLFTNTPVAAISIYDENENQICATPGGTRYKMWGGGPNLEAGFNFDDGFNAYVESSLDTPNTPGYYAICKGKNQYVHGALCACEPEVQNYWIDMVNQALDDGYEMAGNRMECHSVHVDEPFAYGYNDCVKEEYFKRYGHCEEKDMQLDKIAKIRGDSYSKYYKRFADVVRARNKKVYLSLNLEMLHKPLPLDRRYAYPMNVEWQWERWLEEMKPDEITIRTYYFTPEFALSNPQCRKIINKAKEYNVPISYERYTYWDFAEDYSTIRDSGDFDNIVLYETDNIIKSDGNGGIKIIDKDLVEKLALLKNKDA